MNFVGARAKRISRRINFHWLACGWVHCRAVQLMKLNGTYEGTLPWGLDRQDAYDAAVAEAMKE